MSVRHLKDELKKKLTDPNENAIAKPAANSDTSTSKYFQTPFWKSFYDIEFKLNAELRPFKISNITHIYNPIEYACEVHCEYLRKFLTGRKKLMLIGMNPGPNGMAQNGVPFGNTKTVRHLMQLEGVVEQPPSLHPKRPITGLSCSREEPSGLRIWGLVEEISGSLEVFSQQCFMHNFCPLAFFDAAGKNITPGELKGDVKSKIREICLKYLDEEIHLIQPEVVVAIGSYVGDCMKKLSNQQNYIGSNIRFLQLAHPSPRSLNNNDWPEKAKRFFEENDLIKYLRNEN